MAGRCDIPRSGPGVTRQPQRAWIRDTGPMTLHALCLSDEALVRNERPGLVACVRLVPACLEGTQTIAGRQGL